MGLLILIYFGIFHKVFPLIFKKALFFNVLRNYGLNDYCVTQKTFELTLNYLCDMNCCVDCPSWGRC